MLHICRKDYIRKSKWIGVGPSYCKNSTKLLKRATIQREKLVSSVSIYYGDSVISEGKLNIFWNKSDDYQLGTCHTFEIPEQYKEKAPIYEITFQMASNVNWIVHTPGLYKNARVIDGNFFNFENDSKTFSLDYEVFKMLNSHNNPCQEESSYSKDDCNDKLVFNTSLSVLNCTWPFTKNKSFICSNEEVSKNAHKIGKYHLRGKNPTCLNSCTYLKVTYDERIMKNRYPLGKLRFYFPVGIKINQAYYTYKELSLIAEIGGYVGLFLGWSVYQLKDVMDTLVPFIKKIA